MSKVIWDYLSAYNLVASYIFHIYAGTKIENVNRGRDFSSKFSGIEAAQRYFIQREKPGTLIDTNRDLSFIPAGLRLSSSARFAGGKILLDLS